MHTVSCYFSNGEGHVDPIEILDAHIDDEVQFNADGADIVILNPEADGEWLFRDSQENRPPEIPVPADSNLSIFICNYDPAQEVVTAQYGVKWPGYGDFSLTPVIIIDKRGNIRREILE